MSMLLSRQQRIRATIVGSFATFVVLGGLVIKPMLDQLLDDRSQLEQARTSLPAEPNFQPSFAKLQTDLVLLRAELASKRGSFPVAENISGVLREIEGLASPQVIVSHLYPTKVGPITLPKEQAKSGISLLEQQIEMEVTGPYSMLETLLTRLEGYAHPLGVHSIRVDRAEGAALGKEPNLHLKLMLSAYLMDKPLPDMPLLSEDLKETIADVQGKAGVANPFEARGSIPLPLPVPKPAGVRFDPLAVPARVVPVARADSLENWRLTGILYGPNDVAILRRAGEPSLALRVGEMVEDWRLDSIEREGVVLSRGRQQRRLSLPDAAP